jgi:hypothetical protein
MSSSVQQHIHKQQVGAKHKDLSNLLGALVWPCVPARFVVTNTQKLYWILPCTKHLRLMTIQAAKKQLQDPKHPGILTACERCSVGAYRQHPHDPQTHDKHRSRYEILTWLAVEAALCTRDVEKHIVACAPPHNMMVGVDMGYVVEAKVVKGWTGGVDIFVPGLNLLIQIDGEHHDDACQQDKDLAFMCLAVQQKFNVLRVHYNDIMWVHKVVADMFTACIMQHAGNTTPVARCSMSHVLLSHVQFKDVAVACKCE